MKSRKVEFTPEAEADLIALYDYIAEAVSPVTALAYVKRLEAFCAGLAHGSERGSLRSDIREGLRVIGFERSVSLAFTVEDSRVVILRLFYRGRDWTGALS